MIISMISIGTELLDGRVQDSNSGVVGRYLNNFGQSLESINVIPDDVHRIVKSLNQCEKGIVILSGGLGPTDDDLTRYALAQWCGKNLQEDAQSLSLIKEKFESFGVPFTENNRRQALFPKGANILPNTHGTAPAFSLEHEGRHVYVFPGVPREFEWCFDLYLKELIAEQSEERFVRAVIFQGIGESRLASKLPGLEAFDVGVAYRAFYPNLELKLSASTSAELSKSFDYVMEIAEYWYTSDANQSSAEKVGVYLDRIGKKVCTVESCTAGGIGAAITDVPGSSTWFESGFITYSNAAKAKWVGVSEDILEEFGAVSAQVVCQMAAGAQEKTGADYALSVSGIAGPGGGSEKKPVGTVWFGLATPTGTYAFLRTFKLGGRVRIREASVAFALAFLIWELEDRLISRSGLLGPFERPIVFSPHGIPVDEELL